MGLNIYDANNNDALVTTWNSVDHAYISIDYNDAGRDIIKFDDRSFIRYRWKGIYAPRNILDVPDLLKQYFGNRQIQTIVIRTHGNIVNSTSIDENGNQEIIDTRMFCDNNQGNKGDIRGFHLEKYKEDPCFNDKDDKKITEYIEALLIIAAYIKDGGDLAICSCRTGYLPRFFVALQNLVQGRINIYGMKVRTNFLGTRKLINGVPEPGNIAYITANDIFKKELLAQKYSGCAYKFPEGWNDESHPIKLDDFRLRFHGIDALISKGQDIQPIKVSMPQVDSSLEFPIITNP